MINNCEAWTADHDAAREDLAGIPTPIIGSELEPVDPANVIFERAADRRVARCSVRPGMREGQYLGLSVQCWGAGHWCLKEGQPSFVTRREQAERSALRWLESGR